MTLTCMEEGWPCRAMQCWLQCCAQALPMMWQPRWLALLRALLLPWLLRVRAVEARRRRMRMALAALLLLLLLPPLPACPLARPPACALL